MTWYGRSEWTKSSAGCIANFDGPRGVCIHYPGGNLPEGVADGNHGATGAYLNGVRNMQMALTTYNYCDIEYNMCADRRGDVWVLRGMKVRGGANGDTLSNAQYLSIFTLVGLTSAKQPTKEQIMAVRQIIKRWRDLHPKAKEIKGHRDFKATACPGDPLYEMVKDGTFEPALVRRSIRKTIRSTQRAIAKLKNKMKAAKARLDNWR